MSNEVFANGMEVSCKSGDGKVIAAFPDVCLSPPSPPAGPVPVPYPNTSFSKDAKNGSKSVKIGGKEVMQKNKSFFKTAPLGDEAATRSFGGSILSHTITGKTYFAAWSMDVKVEGLNVPRHLDLTTSNHASYPGSTPPFTEMEELSLLFLHDDQCPCCGMSSCTAALPKTHPGLTDSSGNPVPRENYSFREWYRLNETDASGNPTATAGSRANDLASKPCEGGSCPNAGKASDQRKSDPPCDVYRVTSQSEGTSNVGGISQARKRELRALKGVPRSADMVPLAIQRHRDKAVQIDHRTPRTAGGCPTSEDNTVANSKLCSNCQEVDELLDTWSNDELTIRRSSLGL